VDIRIGILNSPREIAFESAEPASAIEEIVSAALAGEVGLLTLSDVKGVKYLIPTATIAFVEVGTEEARRVGFVA
jgi:Protein of unknown function (DUF3107)